MALIAVVGTYLIYFTLCNVLSTVVAQGERGLQVKWPVTLGASPEPQMDERGYQSTLHDPCVDQVSMLLRSVTLYKRAFLL